MYLELLETVFDSRLCESLLLAQEFLERLLIRLLPDQLFGEYAINIMVRGFFYNGREIERILELILLNNLSDWVHTTC